MGGYKSIVKIKNIIESACKTPFLEAMNNPTVSGNNNNNKTPSIRNVELNVENPPQKSCVGDGDPEENIANGSIMPIEKANAIPNKRINP